MDLTNNLRRRIKKSDWKALLTCVLATEGIGFLSRLLPGSGAKAYSLPFYTPGLPPGWVFPLVWFVLYFLMGTAVYLAVCYGRNIKKIKRSGRTHPGNFAKQTALMLYLAQLGANFFWNIFLYGFHWYVFSLLWLLLLISLVFLTFKHFVKLNRMAGALLLPYMLWLMYTVYLNYGLWALNA